ncbi:Multimodular transpeptidase-transglycosylase [Minicystis rosea]|nr:Multimodular transpeptidase-transglycosylase [Minicystis rosea]
MALARIRRILSARRPSLRRLFGFILIALIAPCLALVVAAAMTPLPPELAAHVLPSTSVVLRDRHGVVLRELRADDGIRARWVPLEGLGDRAQRAILAAEDRRFAHHPGVDPLAVLRAAGQLVTHGRIVSGASTITQQLARNVVKRPRTLRGKFMEAALALRIEASLSKQEILEQYLNRVSFGPGLRGIEAASRFYFDKATRDLSLAEVAALAGIPRGPAVYDPQKGTDRLRRRRDRVLDRMRDAGFASRADVDSAKAEPIVISRAGSGQGAPHLVRALMTGTLDPALASLRNRAASLTLTIDRGLQRELEVLAEGTVRALSSKHVSAASIVVLENATGEILAYVGSPDIEDLARLGHNDGVLAARQPGSTLKPFVYELALARLGFTAATVLPDVELILPSKDGTFRPNNYDGRFHGPVRLREALANSYNVPAVWTADALGPARVLTRLRDLGLASLTEDPSFYGAAIALGDGEARLLDLANAYATLARGGVLRPVIAVKAGTGKDGAAIEWPHAEPRRVLDEAASWIITDILADKAARLASFGEGNVLELPFPVAAKTGTSKAFRDNYTVGFTPDVTVAVWVGNFDGSPMEGVSGVSGAGPLFHDAMIAAVRGRPVRAFDRPAELIEETEVCSLSGTRPTEACPHRRREVFAVDNARSTAPASTCTMHERVRIDRRNGLRAGRDCSEAFVEPRILERYDARLTAWARAAGRPLVPDAWSPLCPPSAGESSSSIARGALRIAFPTDGAHFAIDPSSSARQEIRIRADVPAGITDVRFVIDGIVHPARAPFAITWPLRAGHHRMRVEVDGMGQDEIEIDVD